MSHISYALVVHKTSGRIVYKTRNKTGGDVNPTIKTGTLQPFEDECYVGDTLQPDYVIGRIALDDHQTEINYKTQRWDSSLEQLRNATPEEIAEYKDLVDRADATHQVSKDRTVTALIKVLAPLQDLSVSELTARVVDQLKGNN